MNRDTPDSTWEHLKAKQRVHNPKGTPNTISMPALLPTSSLLDNTHFMVGMPALFGLTPLGPMPVGIAKPIIGTPSLPASLGLVSCLGVVDDQLVFTLWIPTWPARASASHSIRQGQTGCLRLCGLAPSAWWACPSRMEAHSVATEEACRH